MHGKLYYCNALTVDEIDKLLPADQASLSVHQVNSEQLKTKLINLHYFKDTLEALILSMTAQNVAAPSEDLKTKITVSFLSAPQAEIFEGGSFQV